MITVAIVNQKGGVGKTTCSTNLAAATAMDGYKVLLVDFDPQANATDNIGIVSDDLEIAVQDVLYKKVSLDKAVLPTSIKNLFVLPANINLDTAAQILLQANFRESLLKKTIADTDYDFIFVDCNPSINLLTVNAIYASDYILIPLNFKKNALSGFSNILNEIKNLKPSDFNLEKHLRLILNEYDQRKVIVNEWVTEQLKHYEKLQFKTIIRVNSAFEQAEVAEQPILLTHPNSPGAKDIKNLYNEFKQLCQI